MKSILIALLLQVSFGSWVRAETPSPQPLDPLLLESRKAFYKDDFDTSIQYLEKYFTKLQKLPKLKAKSLFRFFSIASIGQIYLQKKQDPKGAIAWLEKIQKTHFLSEAESSIVASWIAGIQEWMKLGALPKDIQDADKLFELGKKYYETGLKKQKYTMDVIAVADFSIASSYLVPFMVHFDKNPKTGEVLYMMGDMRRRIWGDNQNWSQNYYLSEAIRRFPGTPLAVKSYKALEEDVHFGYSGSAGDSTPSSWVELLGQLKKIAEGAPETQEKPKTLN